MWWPSLWTRVLGPTQQFVYPPAMTKRGIITIVVLLAVGVAAVLYFVFRPGEAPEPMPVYTIAIDAGHGGNDPGATDAGVLEKDINLTVAKLVRDLAVAEEDLDPILIRDLDIFISLEDRIARAEEAGAMLYVTVHVNSYTGPDPEGVETIVDSTRDMDDDSWILASLIQDEVVNATGARDRGTRMQESYVQRTEMPAVSVEIGFITNPAERENLVDPAYQQQIAEGIAAGIRQYIDYRYPQEEETP